MNNAGNYADRLSVTDALAQSPNTAFIKLEEFTGVPDVVDMAVRLGMKSLATDAVRGPEHRAAHRPVDRRGDQGAEAGLVHPGGHARRACWSWPTSAPRWPAAARGARRQPDRVDHRPARAARSPLTEAPCDQAVEPGLANTLLTALSKDDQPGGTSAAAAAQVGWNRPVAAKTGTTQEHKSAAFVGSSRSCPVR